MVWRGGRGGVVYLFLKGTKEYAGWPPDPTAKGERRVGKDECDLFHGKKEGHEGTGIQITGHPRKWAARGI